MKSNPIFTGAMNPNKLARLSRKLMDQHRGKLEKARGEQEKAL